MLKVRMKQILKKNGIEDLKTDGNPWHQQIQQGSGTEREGRGRMIECASAIGTNNGSTTTTTITIITQPGLIVYSGVVKNNNDGATTTTTTTTINASACQ